MLWITGEHRHLIRKQNKLHKRLKQHCTLENKKKYNNHRKKVNTILYKAEQMYVNKLSNNYSKQPKRFWNFVKQNRSNQSGIGTLKYKGYLYSTDEDKAEVLSKQFQSVFIQDEPEILQKTKYVSSNSGSNTQCENYISDIYISPTDVYKQLRQLDPNKSTGPDNICARVLKATAS